MPRKVAQLHSTLALMVFLIFFFHLCLNRALWWVDKAKQTLDTVTLSPDLEVTFTTQKSYPSCSVLGPLYADPLNGLLYMMEKCGYSVTSSYFKGTESNSIGRYLTSSINPLKTYRVAKFGNKLYWATENRFYSLDTTNRVLTNIFNLSVPIVSTLTIVHSSLQPQGTHLQWTKRFTHWFLSRQFTVYFCYF